MLRHRHPRRRRRAAGRLRDGHASPAQSSTARRGVSPLGVSAGLDRSSSVRSAGEGHRVLDQPAVPGDRSLPVGALLEGRNETGGISHAEPQCAEPAREPWTIRPYRSGDEREILALFNRVFGAERTLQHWYWEYRDNPVGEIHIYLAVTDSGRIVGQYAGLPVLFHWDGRTLQLVQILDVVVDPAFRSGLKKPGLFVKLAGRYIGDYPGAGGFGFPPILPLRIGRQVGYIEFHRVEQLKQSLVQPPARSRSIASWQWIVEEVPAFDARANRLWARCRPELPVAAIRDARYLNWRYAQHPEVRYRLLVVRRRFSDEWAGLAVLRLGGGKATAFLGQGESAACLVDWLAPLGERWPTELLLTQVHRTAQENGMSDLYAWFRPGSAHWNLLIERGFRPEPTPMHFTAHRCIDDISLEWARDRWYYTMGDSDIY